MKIALLGYGKMGKAVEKIAIERGHEIVLKITSEESNYDLSVADLAIDFSNPNVAFQNLYNCIEKNIPVVSGTTGWLLKYDEFIKFCEQKNGSFLYASNFSIGVNLFFNLNEYLARMMEKIKGYDVEIKEIHHIHKLDKPSGTAISLAEKIIEHSNKEEWFIEKRSEKDLYIHVDRSGEVPGIHRVKYESKVDKIEIEHTAFNRDGFALGAIIAAEWLIGKKGVFSMKDVLGL
jgi:4-hydroxy-tetrahydrodipicolinate reductase